MYRNKIEVIIYSENKILIQEITLEHVVREEMMKPVLREPLVEELSKIHKAVVNTINSRVDTYSGKLED